MDANENAIYAAMEQEDGLDVDLDELEGKLESEIDGDLAELIGIIEDRERISNPDALGETVMNVVWEQFMNQVATTAGVDFIAENGGMTLDLSDDAHIQTTENFAKGKIAKHNTEIDYQKRHDEWEAKFQHDDSGERIVDTHHRGKDTVHKLQKGARADYDKGRPKGSDTAATNMDHTIAAAEIIRDAETATHLTHEEAVAFANSETNLNLMDSSANQSKGDMKMEEWLERERNGEKPADRFDIDEEQLREKDRLAREEYEKLKAEGKKRSIEAGRKSQKQEFFRIGGKALRTALMMILASLAKELFGKLILWLKSAEKNLHTLIEYVKTAILSFVGKFKELLINVSSSVLTTIATAIIGPVVGVIRKTITLLKQGWKSLKEAVQYLRDPANKGKPFRYLLPEVGKIVVAGLSGVGAIVLGEFIEGILMAFPFMSVNIPVLGTPANLVGMLLGAIICGVIGAIALNLIDKFIAKKQAADNQVAQIDKKNEILEKQEILTTVKVIKLQKAKAEAGEGIIARHIEAADEFQKAKDEIMESDEGMDTKEKNKRISGDLDKLLQL
ncbi:hypothetical protein [Lactococcus sp. UBA7220]|uniref:hypothetical protein n=1 Tax=Lactococcus sp. UBA7220 TaxID=1946735 RepID=UPI0025803CF8|nr:hypothetical protein [Lactococcus sp. UBA7220]